MFFLILSISTFVITKGAEWGYEGRLGPNNWPRLFPQYCAGSNQSPINIDERYVKINRNLDPIQFINYDLPLHELEMENTGSTIDIVPPSSANIAIAGGGLDGKYNLVQCHFHWGSEHTIHGRQYPFETHCVHMNERYSSIEEAVKDRKGLAVIGFLHSIRGGRSSSYSNLNGRSTELFNQIASKLKEIRRPETKTTLTLKRAIPLSVILPKKTESYYRYQGSLTTPACNEAVVWTVFTSLQSITRNQLNEFTKILNEEGHRLRRNYRPPQPLNGRTVQCSKYCLSGGTY